MKGASAPRCHARSALHFAKSEVWNIQKDQIYRSKYSEVTISITYDIRRGVFSIERGSNILQVELRVINKENLNFSLHAC
ncbi:hypothetical protein HN51_003111 [Arachis hypogaea]